MPSNKIAVIIPCYQVRDNIISVIGGINSHIKNIYVVDDACPQKSGDYVRELCKDERVKVIYNHINQGVGGAVIAGYKEALKDDNDILVKLDGDGQMDPSMINSLIAPIISGKADYTKGNRFFYPEEITDMPLIRIIGNIILSFVNKISSGYWNIFDPTNGYTAISRDVLKMLPLDKINKRYFFESDMLFRLNIIRAVVYDVPMPPIYNNEKSGFRIFDNMFLFARKHICNSFKRIFYNYYLRDFSIASIELSLGGFLLILGIIFGIINWQYSIESSNPATAGTVMLCALPIIIGFQLLLSFLNYDVTHTPTKPITNIVG